MDAVWIVPPFLGMMKPTCLSVSARLVLPLWVLGFDGWATFSVGVDWLDAVWLFVDVVVLGCWVILLAVVLGWLCLVWLVEAEAFGLLLPPPLLPHADNTKTANAVVPNFKTWFKENILIFLIEKVDIKYLQRYQTGLYH